jgi:E3 ubiquitin-protein ligase HACE1
VLLELGAGASLSAEASDRATPAHMAAQNGREGCLRVLHELGAGASLSAEDDRKGTPAHLAARKGHEGFLRVLHELGAGASLSAEDTYKQTPAHWAAVNGHEGCLRVLHECLALMIDPLLKGLAQFRSATITAAIQELQARRAVATRNAVGMTPAHDAAAAGHTSCVRFLSEIGGTAALLQDVQARPELLEDK